MLLEAIGEEMGDDDEGTIFQKMQRIETDYIMTNRKGKRKIY